MHGQTRLCQTWAVVFACIIVFSSEAIKSIIIGLTISPPLMSYTHACLKRFLRVGVYVRILVVHPITTVVVHINFQKIRKGLYECAE